MLKRIRITGFRSCGDVTLDNLGDITALIGRNAAGKTNVLKGIEWVGRLATSPPVPDLLGDIKQEDRLQDWKARVTTEAELEIDNLLYHYELRVDWRGEPNTPAHTWRPWRTESATARTGAGEATTLFVRRDERVESPLLASPVALGAEAPTMFALPALLPGSTELLLRLEPLRRFFAGMRYYPLTEPTHHGQQPRDDLIIFEADYEAWLGQPQARTTPRNTVMQILDLSLRRKDVFEELARFLGEEGLGLIDNITVTRIPLTQGQGGAANGRAFWYIGFGGAATGGESRLFAFSQLSQGTRRIIRLVLSLLDGSASVMLIEHPEDNIHRGLVSKVIGLLKGGPFPGQIILSTHSDTVMNCLEPEEIRLVEMIDGTTRVRSLEPKELEVCGKFVGSDDGLTLADFVHSVVED